MMGKTEWRYICRLHFSLISRGSSKLSYVILRRCYTMFGVGVRLADIEENQLNESLRYRGSCRY